MIDPITQVYQYIINGIKDNADIQAIVPAVNIIDLTASRLKDKHITADYPFIVLLYKGKTMNFVKSQNSTIEVEFELLIATDQEQIADSLQTQTLLAPLEWTVEKALFPLIGGSGFVSDGYIDFTLQGLGVTESTVEQDDTQFEAGTIGWNSVLNIVAVLSIPVATMEG